MSQPSDIPRRAAVPVAAPARPAAPALSNAAQQTPTRADRDDASSAGSATKARDGDASTEPKQIQTLPPLEELHDDLPLSRRTGEPRRIPLLLVSNALFYLAGALQVVVYGLHWYRAVYPESFGRSAQLIAWLDPEPGTWQSLALLASLAALLAATVASCGIAAFQSWNGWRWSRIAAIVAVAFTAASAALFEYTHGVLGWVAVGLAALGAVLLWLPPLNDYFRLWKRFHDGTPLVAYRPERVYYGRLPRFR